MSSMWVLSTDDVVTTLIVICISALAIAWVFAGRRSPKKVDNLEARRLAGREAETYVAPVTSPQLAEIHVPTPSDPLPEPAETLVSDDLAPSVLQLGETSDAQPAAPAPKPAPPPAEKRPLSAEQSSAISIAAALVRHDKRRPEAAEPQKAETCETLARQPSGAGGDDLTVINGIDRDLAEQLNKLGIHYFDQIASWSPEHAGWIASRLGLAGENGPQGAWIVHAQALSNPSLAVGPDRIIRRS